MNIKLSFSFLGLNSKDLPNQVVVVIDILRATTSMVTAFTNGALSVISVSEIEKAVALKQYVSNSLLCGERNGVKIEGFDKGNSPKEFRQEVNSKNLIFSSTNGSKTIDKAKDSKIFYLGAFSNANSLFQHLVNNHIDDEIMFACSGKAGSACIEDTLCAGYIIDLLVKDSANILLDDSSIMARDFYVRNEGNVCSLILNSEHGRFLENIGLQDDVESCCKIDTTTIIPYYDKSKSKIII